MSCGKDLDAGSLLPTVSCLRRAKVTNTIVLYKNCVKPLLWENTVTPWGYSRTHSRVPFKGPDPSVPHESLPPDAAAERVRHSIQAGGGAPRAAEMIEQSSGRDYAPNQSDRNLFLTTSPQLAL